MPLELRTVHIVQRKRYKMAIRTEIEGHFSAVMRAGRFFVFIAVLTFFATKQSFAASLQSIADFGANPGQLNMYVYVPEGRESNSVMVVALHGCDQKATEFDDETGLIRLADTLNFTLVLPEQRLENNDKRCFNWFRGEDIRRDQGETGSIRNMIKYTIDKYDTNPSKIFVLGLSAGGSMTAVLMANYPELFQGGAIIAGTPFECNNPTAWNWAWWWWLDASFGDAAAASYACGLFGSPPTQRSPQAWGDYVRAAPGTAPQRWPKVSLWQGDADDIVNPGNQVELIKQWTNVHGIDQEPDDSDIVDNVQHNVYRDSVGLPRVETYEIADLGHAFPIDPGPGPDQCGTIAPYVKDANVCSTLKILRFWGVTP
jgi:poly(3-hydroxybutyrate) depolymerase